MGQVLLQPINIILPLCSERSWMDCQGGHEIPRSEPVRSALISLLRNPLPAAPDAAGMQSDVASEAEAPIAAGTLPHAHLIVTAAWLAVAMWGGVWLMLG